MRRPRADQNPMINELVTQMRPEGSLQKANRATEMFVREGGLEACVETFWKGLHVTLP